MKSSSKYVIVGGGMTADAAVRGIRDRDTEGEITVLSAEKHPPYDRPPLSKKLWTGKPFESIWRKTDEAGVNLRLESRVVAGDAAARTVTDDAGNVYSYEKLLLATGGTPRHLPFTDEGVIYFRNLDDYQHTRTLADRNARFVVIGGGFIGSEIAAALAKNGCAVSMIFPGSGIGDRIYPAGMSKFLNGYYQEKGITLLAGERVVSIGKSDVGMSVQTGNAEAIECDAVIAGIGITPEVGLAESIGLAVDNGIVVDEFLGTTHTDIYAAGDVANFYSSDLDLRRRVEHEDNANTMGRIAGRNMAGASEKYDHLPYFYSDLFDLGYEAVGELDTNMEIVEDWTDPFRQGVVYYLRDGRVRGVLLWNTWDKIDAARELIRARDTQDSRTLKGRISN